MGSSQNRTQVVVIDESDQKEQFDPLLSDSNFTCNYYSDYDKFLENQSLKELSYIIIRERSEPQEEANAQNSMIAKTKENRRELSELFGSAQLKKQQTLKERLITYIRKYSLEKLVLYLLVEDVLKFRIPDYEAPYITLVADKIDTIKLHINNHPIREEAFNFKFRRLVKDLYKRTMVKIISENQSKEEQSDWKTVLKRYKLSNDFCQNEQEFAKGLIANFNQYIIIKSADMLTKIIDQKKKHDFESKLIYVGQTQVICEEKKQFLWMISEGKSLEDKEKIALTIKRCTDVIVDEEAMISQNTIIFTDQQYTADEENYIKSEIISLLKSSKKAKEGDKQAWIDDLNIKIVSNYKVLREELKNSIFSFLVTFDCLIPSIENLKRWIRKEKLNYRVYMYNVEEKQSEIAELNEKKNTNPGAVKEYLNKKIAKIVENTTFKIKFEIGPIESITTYKARPKQLKYLRTKMGLITTNIESKAEFQAKYLSHNREELIQSFYIMCRVQDYQHDLAQYLDAPEQNTKTKNSYFNKIKIIIFDDQQRIKGAWNTISKEERIVFVHYNLGRIQDYLDNVFTPRVAVSFFVKKALPNFFEAMRRIEAGKNKYIHMNGSIVSKNELLKQVFGDKNFRMSMEYELSFRKFSSTNRNSQFDVQVLQTQFLAKYSNLWRVGYEIVKDKSKNQECIYALREDIKRCLFKCKSYELIEVSDEEFDYFYLNRLDACETYIDLQIAAIYIFSLPHGFSNIFQQIFNRPQATCLTPKIFASYLVTLLTAFCSFEDEVMDKKRLVVYVNDQIISAKMETINPSDILFNTGFLLCGKDEHSLENSKNNCIFFEFEDLPMLAESRIKNYLYIERFSFYKESTEYLVAPYTKFIVKSKTVTEEGKYHITLSSFIDSRKGFISNIFQYNEINEELLFSAIKQEIGKIESKDTKVLQNQKIKNIGSLYKKAELIGLYEEKLQLVKSIKEGYEYKKFLSMLKAEKFLSALSHIRRKENTEKSTTEIQALYFKKMLGVEKSLLFYKLCEYDISIKQLEKVIQYLQDQKFEENEGWVIAKVKNFKKVMEDVSVKRHKLLNRAEKVKHWRIQPQIIDDRVIVVMKERQMKWKVGYISAKEEFFIQEVGSPNINLPYHIKSPYGEQVPSFANDTTYQQTTFEELGDDVMVEKVLKNQFMKPFEGKGKSEKESEKESAIKVQPQISKTDSKPHLKPQKDAKALPIIKETTEVVSKGEINPKSTQNLAPKTESSQQRLLAPDDSNNLQVEIISNASSFRAAQSQQVLSDYQKKLGIKGRVEWQAFYYEDKFLLTKKGKHYKAKLPSKLP